MRSKVLQAATTNTGLRAERGAANSNQPALLGLLLAVGLLLAGCVVTSVYPYYTEKDLVFDATLLGDWRAVDEKKHANDFVRIERVGEKGYRVTAFDEEQTNSVIHHLFRLDNQLFFDACPTNDALDRIPVHQLSKVIQLPPVWETAALDYKWLEELLKETPQALRHVIVDEKGTGTNDGRIVLTADTAALQKFIRQHVNNPNAWQETNQVKLQKR